MSADQFTTSDAAYVLGLLSESERLDFEAHLLTCDECSARVAELQDMPALLALAPESAFEDPEIAEVIAEQATSPWADTPMPDTLLPRLLRGTRRERNRRRLFGAAAVVALAACLVVALALVLPARAGSYRPPAQATAMVNLVDVPIEAEVQVVDNDSWAQVNLWCKYTREESPSSSGNYEAVARTKSGQTVVLGSWPAVPGQTAIIRTPTQLHPADIASIDIVGWSGKALSRLTL